MIINNGIHGNFGVECDADECKNSYLGRRNNDIHSLSNYTIANVRRQARRRGWATIRHTDGVLIADLCPAHTSSHRAVEIESVDQLQISEVSP